LILSSYYFSLSLLTAYRIFRLQLHFGCINLFEKEEKSQIIEDLHLDYGHVISNLVIETIDYLVRLSYLKVLEHVTLSTSHHSIQQAFAKDYEVLFIDHQ
jgi:hypothetical protein